MLKSYVHKKNNFSFFVIYTHKNNSRAHIKKKIYEFVKIYITTSINTWFPLAFHFLQIFKKKGKRDREKDTYLKSSIFSCFSHIFYFFTMDLSQIFIEREKKFQAFSHPTVFKRKKAKPGWTTWLYVEPSGLAPFWSVQRLDKNPRPNLPVQSRYGSVRVELGSSVRFQKY